MIDRLRSAIKQIALTLGVVLIGMAAMLGVQILFYAIGSSPVRTMENLTTFTTVFLGIFIEAAPFLLLGTLASGLVDVFLSKDSIARLAPRNPALGAVFGSLLGFGFPVCECGVVPLTRRLLKKGIPPHVGIAFLLASPVVNPIVIASTLAAFGFGKIFLFRIGLSIAIATLTGLVFSFRKDQAGLLRGGMPAAPAPTTPVGIGAAYHAPAPPRLPLWPRLRAALTIAADEFFEMGRYLIAGALLAALMQTFVPRTFLLGFNQGPIIPVLARIVLAVVLSVCSTVDAFVALAFISSFSNGSILAFLVFGAMVDIKSALLFLQVFERRTVVYLILLPLLMTILSAVLINMYLPL